MINIQNLKKYLLIGCLYISQYMPAWFLYSAIPIFMRQQGLSLEAIGLLPTLALPVTLRFLWSPLIDRYGFTRWGHYRFWIICFQVIVAFLTTVSAFLDIKQNFNTLLACMGLMYITGASQDIATDALAIGLLAPKERGIGNAVQSAGGFLGGIIGGGTMLILLERWGWKPSLLLLAVITLVALIPVLFHKEDFSAYSPPSTPYSLLTSLLNIFHYRGMWCWLLILLLDSASSSIASTMFRPLLVDIGLSLADIGWLIGTINYGCLMIGGLIGGLLISTLGRKWSLFLFSLLSIFASLIYLLPSFGWKSLPVLYFVAISTGLVGGLMATTTFTIMMDKSGEDTPGTDYTVQSSSGVLGSIGAAAISGKLAETIGYRGVFGLGIVFAVICFLLVNILPALSRSSSEHQN